MRRLKFIARYIRQLFIKSPVKTVLIIISIIIINVVSNYDKVPVKYNVVNTFEHFNNTVYIVTHISNNDIEYESKIYADEKPPIIDEKGFIIEMELEDYIGWLLVILFILVVIIIVTIFDADDTGWQCGKIYKNCLVGEVKRYNDRNKIYFVYRNKVIHVQNYVDDLYNAPKFDQHSLLGIISTFKESPQLYDDYNGTKSEIRNKKIDSVVA